MGYKRPVKTYNLIFEDEEFNGLEVQTRSLPLGQFMNVMNLADAANGQGSANDTLKAVGDLFENFATALISWNLENEDGSPVPADIDGIKSQDMEFILAIVRAWLEAVSSVNAPLGEGSTGGGTSQVPSIPMETA
jgi:hypothetical protein